MRFDRFLVAAALAAALLLAPAGAFAELFVSLYAGGALTQSDDLTQKSGGVEEVFKDLSIDKSPVFGGKIGYWLFDHFGVELDLYTYSPDIPAQTAAVVNRDTGGRSVAQVAASNINLFNLGLDFLARLPIPLTKVTPYAGIGPLFSFGSGDSGGGSDDNFELGFQALAGVEYSFLRQLAVFVEYKFSHVEHAFNLTPSGASAVQKENDANTHHFYAGLAFHLRLIP